MNTEEWKPDSLHRSSESTQQRRSYIFYPPTTKENNSILLKGEDNCEIQIMFLPSSGSISLIFMFLQC